MLNLQPTLEVKSLNRVDFTSVHASKQDIQNVTQYTIKKAIARESRNPLKQPSQTNRGTQEDLYQIRRFHILI